MKAALALRVHAELNRIAGSLGAVGVALSGGGDSMALLYLARGWCGERRLLAATVDHGLREESADEARFAGQEAFRLSVPHEILTWKHSDISGNLMAAAREARLRLLSEWALRHQLDAVLLGHTGDDQAETLLMRLRRGAGVDGLSGMAPTRSAHGMIWLRPLLGVGRQELRDYLLSREVDWLEDPSNRNEKFERIRTRNTMAGLELTRHNLAQVADNMAQAREALQHYALQAVQGGRAEHASLWLPEHEFLSAPTEIQRRILTAALRWITGADYPARREPVLSGLHHIAAGRRFTLQGAICSRRQGHLHITREAWAAAAAPAVTADARGQALWDGRWHVQGMAAGQQVRALGRDRLALLDRQASGLTQDQAAASPAIWQADRFVAAPLLETGHGFSAKTVRNMGDFRVLLVSH